MRALPVGVPKLMVSTVASGDTSPYVGTTDVTMMHSVVDVAGINRISARIIANAARALAGMAAGAEPPPGDEKPLIVASMWGVTTPCVTTARERLEELGYDVLVFHQTGTGGRSMEELIATGLVVGVLDVTTTELADELVGGIWPPGPERLETAGRLGIPQVVSLGGARRDRHLVHRASGSAARALRAAGRSTSTTRSWPRRGRRRRSAGSSRP